MWDDQRLPLSKIVLEGELKYVSALDVQRAFATLQHVGTFMSQDVKVLKIRLKRSLGFLMLQFASNGPIL